MAQGGQFSVARDSRERFHDDDREERDFDDHALDDVRNHEERRLPIRLNLHAARHLTDYLSGHVSGRWSGHLCGYESDHVSGHA